jgi:CheY-like chemotaxis protein/signal transduction histidine kinase
VSSTKVLVVDDDPSFLDLMTMHLRKRGFLVEGARDGLEAFQILRARRAFDVVVTDLMMPGLSGLELLRMVRKLDPFLEVIVITAGGSLEMAISALREDGAFDYLTKPLEMLGELSLAVERAASHRSSRLEKESMRVRLLAGQQELKNLLGSTGDAILAANERDEIAIANFAASRLLGVSEIIDKEKRIPLPESLACHVAHWRALNGNQTVIVEIPWTDGRVFLARMVPMMDVEGKRSGWMMILRDVTYQKRLEMFIVRSFAKVTARIRQPIEQARVIMSQLEKSFSNGSANPREKIIQLRHLFDLAYSRSDELIALNRDGSVAGTEEQRITIGEFLRSRYADLANRLQAGKRMVLRWDVSEDLPPLEVEYPTMAKLFEHLIHRAVLRSQIGDEIVIHAYQRDAYIWLEVIDTGPMYGEIIAAIPSETSFEVQSQLMERSEVELAVVKMLAEQLRGQVWTRLAEEDGISIAICFPLIPERIMA